MKLIKPKFWDYKKPIFLSYLLLPFTLPLIINNFFLSLKKKNSTNIKTKTICIGNIYIGGTSKTPLTVKMHKILTDLNFKTAIIKKFYSNQIDEQIILAKKTKLYCLKNRKKGLSYAMNDDIDVAIFDDGLQDRSMSYDLKFVCFNDIKSVGNGFLIPAGPLREKIESVSKYDAAFINGNNNKNEDLKLLIKKYNNDIEIFESNYIPTNIKEFNINKKYIIFSGIGNPESFKETLIKNKLNVIKEIVFPDHYKYKKNDIDNIRFQARNLEADIITTEKDYVKITSDKNKDIKILKVELGIKNEEKLIAYIKKNI
jgi:tetraacyldisaccharide 4'-kinase